MSVFYLHIELTNVQFPVSMAHWLWYIIPNLNIENLMSRIVKIQNGGHIEPKQSRRSSRWVFEKNSNWYPDPHCFVFIYRVSCSYLNYVLQAYPSWLFNIGSIICKTGVELKATAQKYFQMAFVFYATQNRSH